MVALGTAAVPHSIIVTVGAFSRYDGANPYNRKAMGTPGMPGEEMITATLAGALLQVRAARGTMPDEKEAVQVYLMVLEELQAQSDNQGGRAQSP